MKVLRCSDAGFNCNAEVKADTEEEVLAQAAIHAQQVHNVTVTPEMETQLRTLIRDGGE